MQRRMLVSVHRAEALCGILDTKSACARLVVRPIRLANACARQTGNMWLHQIRACVLMIECPMPMECASAQVDACGMLARLAACALVS